MTTFNSISRRRFMGGMAATLGALGLSPEITLAQAGGGRRRANTDDYDSLAKLSFNENPFGPPESVLEAMKMAFKYANRYGYPDGGLVQAIAEYHGVQTSNILLGAGSTEILSAVAAAFVPSHKKVIGVKPTFSSVYQFATGDGGSSIELDLLPDHRQDIPALIKATKDNAKDVGFVYLCNPNNPTGNIVKKQEVAQLLDGIPQDVPVLIDEAYHHFVEDPEYSTSTAYVTTGRPVIIARTFSKIAALAGVRLGYAVAKPDFIQKMRPHVSEQAISALAKWGGVTAIKDTASQAKVKADILELRKKTTKELEGMGFPVIPSEANFFMVNLKRPAGPVRNAFAQRGILVGRDFPPMMDFLRVSVGNADEMARFTAAFKEIMTA